MIKPILKYPGAKWRLAPWIASYLPEHETYIEPYCGSAAVFFVGAPDRLHCMVKRRVRTL